MQRPWKAMSTLSKRGAASKSGQGWAKGSECKGDLGNSLILYRHQVLNWPLVTSEHPCILLNPN
eukprot:3439140-Pyramimonas_sp.AAC.1